VPRNDTLKEQKNNYDYKNYSQLHSDFCNIIIFRIITFKEILSRSLKITAI